ncbi:MAG: hypothetical protein H7256_00085 [Bdellovibrio sp.]|nr:hypothetical protein [Bdellovibrio sp.]
MKVTLLKNKGSAEADFYRRVPGKWILAGEHTVLRGGHGLVFPLFSQYLEISYFKSNDDFEIELAGVNSEGIKKIVISVFDTCFTKLNVDRNTIKGLALLRSNILFGAGMGASATLCVAVTEFFHYLGYIAADLMYDFARELENIFHGESSGLDVAVVLKKKPLLFSRANGSTELQNTKLPLLYLSHTGCQGITKECVEKVKALLAIDPVRGQAIDDKMKLAVAQFAKLLTEPNIADWIKTLNLAHSCFYDWGLVNETVKAHEKLVLDSGALAVKLTGSGAGGFMLSLWDKEPQNLSFPMIPCAEIK